MIENYILDNRILSPRSLSGFHIQESNKYSLQENEMLFPKKRILKKFGQNFRKN